MSCLHCCLFAVFHVCPYLAIAYSGIVSICMPFCVPKAESVVAWCHGSERRLSVLLPFKHLIVLLPPGNNIPVFFERDGAVFVEQNKCLKPNPVTGIQEGWRVLDFLSHHPESTHVVRSIPSCAAVLSGADGLPLSYHLLSAPLPLFCTMLAASV